VDITTPGLDPDRTLCSISVPAELSGLLKIPMLTGEGLNIAGIRRVLQLAEETRALQAEVAGLRGLADGTGDPDRRAQISESGENLGSLSRESLGFGRSIAV
jgi:hypothetical protein